MGSAAWRARAGVLVLGGAMAVHELRYLLSARQPDEHVHAYMGPLVPIVCALLVLAAVELVARIALRRRRTPEVLAAAGVRWLAISSLLFGIFAVQETAELLLAHGRLELADSLVVHGSWLAAPLSFAVGAAVALVLRGARALLSGERRGRPAARRRVAAARRPHAPRTPRVPVIARHLASRAPPSLVN
jgi:hypothetical protein